MGVNKEMKRVTLIWLSRLPLFFFQQADFLGEGFYSLGQSGYGYGKVYQYQYDADYEDKKDGRGGVGYSKEGCDDIETFPPYRQGEKDKSEKEPQDREFLPEFSSADEE